MNAAPEKRFIDVTELSTGEVVHSIDVTGKDDRFIEKCIRGQLINLDRDNYCVGERAR